MRSIHSRLRKLKTHKRVCSLLFSLILGLALFGGFSLEAFADSGERNEPVTVSSQIPAIAWSSDRHTMHTVSANSGNTQYNLLSNEEYTYVHVNVNLRTLFQNTTDIERYYTGYSYVFYTFTFDYNFNNAYYLEDISPTIVGFSGGNPDDRYTYNSLTKTETTPATGFTNRMYKVSVGFGSILNNSVRMPAELNDTFEIVFLIVRRCDYPRYFDSTINVNVQAGSTIHTNWTSYLSERAYLDSIDEKLDALSLLEYDNSGTADNLNNQVSSAAAVESAADGAISNALPDAGDELDDILDYDYSSIGSSNLTALSFWKQLGDYILSNSNLVGIGALLVGCLFLGFVIYLLRL